MNARTTYALAYAGAAGFQKGLGLLLFLWLAHTLPVAAYAEFGLFYAMQTGVAAFAIAGIIESVVGLLGERKSAKQRAGLFKAANSVFLLLAIISLALATVAYRIMAKGAPVPWSVLLFVGAGGVLGAFFTLQALLARLEEKHAASLCLNTLPALAGLLAGWLGFLLGGRVSDFFTGTAVGFLLSLPPLLRRARQAHSGADGRRDVRLILLRITPFILIVVLGWLAGYGNTYLVKYFFTPTEVARFTFAYTVSSIMQLVATSLNQVWSPRFFQIVHELPIAEVEHRNRRFGLLQGLALGLCGGGVLALAPALVRAVGPTLAAYDNLALEMFFLFAAYAVSIPWWHVQNYYYVHGKGAELMNITIATSALGMAAWIGLMAMLGAVGVYAGFFVMMLLRSAGVFLCGRRNWAILCLWEGPALATLLLGTATLLASVVGSAPH